LLNIRLMAVAGSPNSPLVAGSILVTDNITARTLANYFTVEISGTTAQRPQPRSNDFPSLAAGSSYYDTTLSKTIYFDGVSWRHPASGAQV
jgi:hypothetical protein